MTPPNAERRPQHGSGAQVAGETTASVPPFQLLPALSPDEYSALRADIAERGILVAILVDQHGRILDGHHRAAIAAELGVTCPTEVHEVADDHAAGDVAVTLNGTRRHLNQEQRRALIATEITRRPQDSDRAIARRVGCDHKTVGSVRRGGENPHPEPMTVMEKERARELLDQINALIARGLEQIDDAVRLGVAPSALVSRFCAASRRDGVGGDVMALGLMPFLLRLAELQAEGDAAGRRWVLDDDRGRGMLADLIGGGR